MAEKDHGGDSPPPLPLLLPLPAAGEMKKRKLFVYEELEEGEIVPSDYAGEDEDDDDDDDDNEVIVNTIGNAIRVSGNEYDSSRRSHFTEFEANGISYQLEDTVLVIPKELDTGEFDFTTKPSVVTIKDITATQEGKVTVTGQMFYRPEIAENENGDNWKTSESRELFFSFDKTEFPAEAVMHKCRVHYIPPNKEFPSAKEYPGFVVQKVYDSKYKELNELTNSGYEDRKRHEIDFLLQKTIAQIPHLAITDQIMN